MVAYKSQAMQQAINKIFAAQTITEFTITIRLTSGTNPSFSYSPLFVDDMSIDQDFANRYADKIIVSFKATDQDYMSIFQNSSKLNAVITFTYVDTTSGGGKKVYSPPPIIKTYSAIMFDPENKFATQPRVTDKTYPMVQQTGSPNTPVKIQLVDTVIYNTNHQQFNGVFGTNGQPNTPPNTISSVLMYITKAYGCNKLYMVPPDNKNNYQHLLFPPGREFRNIFDYVQDTYGVWMKGMEFYYTADTLFLYPPYENNPVIPYTANIYNTFSGSYAGQKSYHLLQGNTISIVSTLKAETQDLTHMAAENKGTGRTFLRSSNVIDGYTTTTQGKTLINSNTALMVSGTSMQPVVPGTNNPKYGKATDNIFKVSSDLAQYQAILISLGWAQAIPYAMYPGHKVNYFYDAANVFNKATGIVESISYTMRKTKKVPSIGQVYACSAQMKFRVDPKAPNISSA